VKLYPKKTYLQISGTNTVNHPPIISTNLQKNNLKHPSQSSKNQMTDIFKQHFNSLTEQNIHFDGIDFYIHNIKVNDDFNNKNFNNLNNDELNKKFHLNYFTFRKLFELIPSIKNPNIIETGSSAWGTNSSILFDRYINKYGGTFQTVDINPQTTERVKSQFISHNSKAFTQDSVEFIKQLPDNSVDVAYLDSFDLDWIMYLPSAIHGKNELEQLLPKLKKKSYVLIDDTPSIPDYAILDDETKKFITKRFQEKQIIPGKGMLADSILDNYPLKYEKIIHQYQVLYKIEKL